MAEMLAFILAAVALIVVIHLVAEKTGVPAAALLTVGGLLYSVLPGPNVALDPDVVLTFVIPPLLYSAALNSSLLAIRKNLRVVVSLSVVLVLVTALGVGIGLAVFVPGVTLAAGVALGGAVAPPDPVASLSVGRRAGLPSRMITLIEGEGLLNDATALTILTVAVTAETTESFSLGAATWQFALAAAGGLVSGLAVAQLVRFLRVLIGDPVLVNSISLATPFAAYLLGEELHVSGVLAVVVAGLVVGHDTPRFSSGASRLQVGAVWRLVDFLLEGFVFLLIGQQLLPVIRGLSDYDTSTIVVAVAVTLAVVLLLRPLWLVLTQALPRALHTRLGGEGGRRERGLTGREVLVLSWAGTRGVITLAAVFTLPRLTHDGEAFPGRNLLLFCAFVVVLVTLVGQGVSFEAVARRSGLRANLADAAVLRNEARAASVQAALSRLDQLAEAGMSADVIDPMRIAMEHRGRRYQGRIDALSSSEGGELPLSPQYEAALTAQRAMIDAQREELLRWRDAGRLPDDSLRLLERELDHQERMLPNR